MIVSTVPGGDLTFTRSVVITDGPVIPMLYHANDTRIRAEEVHITYRWTDGAWKIASGSSIVVSGPALRKDGTPGMRGHATSPGLREWTARAGAVSANWTWLDTLIELLRPYADLTIPSLREREIPWVND